MSLVCARAQAFHPSKSLPIRAESSLASFLREHLAHSDDARALLRQIFDTVGPHSGPDRDTLTVRLHHVTQAAHDQAIEYLLAKLNAAQTVFPAHARRLYSKSALPDFIEIGDLNFFSGQGPQLLNC